MLANPTWHRAKHLKLINRKLLDIFTGDNDRLMVFLPPGHGKSSLISETLPAWWLGHRPDDRIMFVSYEHNFASSKGRACRDLMLEHGERAFGLRVRADLQRADEWGIEDHRGVMWSVGVGGPLTGRRAELIIIDDPVKNAEQADSPTYRRKTYDWYKTTLRTRLEPGGAVILVQTRWHEADLAGKLLEDMETGGDQWEVISLPAIAEEHDILGRKPGEALWPERFPLDSLEQTRADNPLRWWTALYQQRPSPEEGGFFKVSFFKYARLLNPQKEHPALGQINEGEREKAGSLADEAYFELIDGDKIKRIPYHKCLIFQTVDPAATEKETSDYFALLTFAMTPDRELIVIDAYNEKAETTKHLDILAQQQAKHSPVFQGIENVSFGLSLLQSARKAGFNIRPLKADRDKVARALTAKIRYEMGSIYHLAGEPWLPSLEAQLLDFPNGKHDDQVDCLAYAAILVGTMPRARVIM